MILEQKVPPPPYNASARRLAPTFSSLPHNILLQIVYAVFPQTDCPLHGDAKLVRQRGTLHWLQSCLRMVNSSLYIACMHILRSTYLPAYNTLIRAPYTSDPFPSTSTSSDGIISNGKAGERPSLIPSHRELRTLDLFIALLTHEDLLLDSTSLHNPRHEAYKDLFVLIQPRSRLEDLFALEGKRRQLVSLPDDTIHNGLASSTHWISAKGKGSSSGTLRRSDSVLSLASETTLNDAASTASSSSSRSQVNEKADRDFDSPYVFSIPPEPRSPSFYSSPNAVSTSTLTHFPQMKRSRSIFSIFMSDKKGKGKAVVPPVPSPPTPPTPRRRYLTPMPFADLSITISPRSATLMYTPSGNDNAKYQGSTYGSLSMSHSMYVGRKRAIVEVPRNRDAPLEIAAIELARGLRSWMEEQ
ncbi:hypothetical protein PQX77_007889 [Marasmius sp. AFHP31]|nr:hypothetical protein PQX77_007889 [Marasmius sp. AFHP31]